MINVFAFRLFTNMDNEIYVNAFFWRDELYRYIIGFNFTIHHESDLIEMVHKFGIFPFILICFKLFYYPIKIITLFFAEGEKTLPYPHPCFATPENKGGLLLEIALIPYNSKRKVVAVISESD